MEVLTRWLSDHVAKGAIDFKSKEAKSRLADQMSSDVEVVWTAAKVGRKIALNVAS